jgi:uncharacterized protein DUF2842
MVGLMCTTGDFKASLAILRHGVARCAGFCPFRGALEPLSGRKGELPAMPVRLKKFIGMFLIVILVIVYALMATTIATYRLAESAWYVHFLYFLVTGVLWVVPAMFLIRWMERPPARKDEASRRAEH